MSQPRATLVDEMMILDTTGIRGEVVPVVEVVQTMKIGHAVDGLVVDVVQNPIHEMAIRVAVVSFAARKFRLGTKRSLRWSNPTSRTTASPVATVVVGVVAVVDVEVRAEAEAAHAVVVAAEDEAAAMAVAVVDPMANEAEAVVPIASAVTAVVLMASEVVAVPMVNEAETSTGIPIPFPVNLR